MSFFERRVRGPLLGLLRQGLSPEGLARSMALGGALGINPLLGTSTALCAVTAALFRLNQPAVQLANYLVYPLQLLLLLPFIRLGERLFQAPPLQLSLAILQASLRSDPWGTLSHFGATFWHAAVAWLLVVPVPAVLLAWAMVPVWRAVLKSFRHPGSLDSLSESERPESQA